MAKIVIKYLDDDGNSFVAEALNGEVTYPVPPSIDGEAWISTTIELQHTPHTEVELVKVINRPQPPAPSPMPKPKATDGAV